ncbi:lantibiotic dehydratase [Streptomyces sp. BR123]|uniref:lantibiotic dehydratase n=1 Tax=Streptomyces sp. BR123 TaxID=2749828 RepID=UPI0015C41BF0|nr:lantibiotic dehydratase [Streptomyces sp. BR123]NXY95654.1 lantibiotic dehydratase [Streptomyces sp. BR123]
MNGKTFEAREPVLVRLAAIPHSRLHATLTGIDPQDPAYPAELTEHLRVLSSDPLFREAVHVSSPQLGRALDEVLAGRVLEARKAERTAMSALRYFLRMGQRPTPFGTMAGVASARLGEHTRTAIGAGHRKHVRADAGWVADVVAEALDDRAIRNLVGVAWNNLCMVRGDRLVMPFGTRSGSRGGGAPTSREVSVRYTPAVATVMEAARLPIEYRRLVETLCAVHPSASEDAVDGMLRSLLKNEVLLTEFQTGHTSDDMLGRLLGLVARAQGAQTAHLRRITDGLEEYSGSAPAEADDVRRDIIRSMSALQPAVDNPLQVDLRMDADVVVGRSVVREAERAATALWRMSPRSPYAHHSAYFSAFLERYGPDTAVPVLDLLDPHAGIGAPGSYAWPASGAAGDQPEQQPGVAARARRNILADLLQDCFLRGHRELVLDDGLVDRLSYADNGGTPRSMDFCVQVLASSTASVDAGDFRLVLSPVAGSARAGTILGRFAHMLGEEAGLRALLTDEPVHEDEIVADLDFQPVESRLRNVARVPRITRRSMAVGTYPADGGGEVLDLADLVVEVQGERLRLVWAPTRTPVRVVVPHMMNLSMAAPNAARLIAELSEDGTQPWRNWKWGELESFPYLPRVRYGRTILHPARWLPSGALQDAGISWAEWLDALREWQTRRSVPDRVRVVIADRYFDLDLREPLHCRLLRTELTRNPEVQVFEACATEADHGWSGGHAAELVFPLKRRGSTAPTRAGASKGASEAVPVVLRHGMTAVQPGGEWLYLKLYAAADCHDRLLATEVPRLLACCPTEIDRWFYIRYADPEPHLRIRLHGKPDAVRGHVTAAVHAWTSDLVARRLIRSTSFEAYEPEETRYGGPGLITAAEDFFRADSEIVVSQLQARAAGRLPVDGGVLAAANFTALLQAFGDWDWNTWIVRAFGRASTPRHLLPPPEQLALLDPSGGWAALSESAGGAALVGGWAHWAAPASAYGQHLMRPDGPTPTGTRALKSLLHMNFNRLFGINREAEVRACGIMRNAAWSHLERTK